MCFKNLISNINEVKLNAVYPYANSNGGIKYDIIDKKTNVIFCCP